MSPELMLIGEAPGEQEALAGRPFVGKAGKNLNEFLELAGLARDQLYVTNAVKFRPTKISAAGVWFEGYNEKRAGYTGASAFSTTPNVYLVPVGTDKMREPGWK